MACCKKRIDTNSTSSLGFNKGMPFAKLIYTSIAGLFLKSALPYETGTWKSNTAFRTHLSFQRQQGELIL